MASKTWRLLTGLSLLCALAGCPSASPPSELPTVPPTPAAAPPLASVTGSLEARLTPSGIKIPWGPHQGPFRVYRCTSPIDPGQIGKSRLPVADLGTSPASPYLDPNPPSGVTLHYLLVSKEKSLACNPLQIPSAPLPSSKNPRLEIDKQRYQLTVFQDSKPLKSYPIAMGRLPQTRKLNYDNASTPEGRYRIYNLQPEATFYRAYDLDYPNSVDKARYQLLRPGQDIGGEIQIHGKGIHSNWTFGCVALRDSDMDELFAHPEIGVDCQVWIYGGELTRADLESDATSSGHSPLELGQLQKKLGLPITCLYDEATRSRLKAGNSGNSE